MRRLSTSKRVGSLFRWTEDIVAGAAGVAGVAGVAAVEKQILWVYRTSVNLD